MTKSFEAQVADFEKMTIESMEYVMRQSISDVAVGAQTTQIGITQGATGFVEGKIPVGMTSELVNSLTVDGASTPAAFAVKIANMEIGDTMAFAWTADHAMPIEMGWTTRGGRSIPGRFFVTRNAEKFPAHVARRSAEVAT